MKRFFLIMSIFFAASALRAQHIKPYGFAGENQAVFLTPGSKKLIELGLGDDNESKFHWESIMVPEGETSAIFSQNKSKCTVLVGKPGSYVYKVSRLSDYGYQYETVTVDVRNDFDILSIKPKENHNCVMTGTVMTVQDFDIETYPPLERVYDYVDVRDGSYTVWAQSMVGVILPLDIQFGQIHFVKKELIGTEYQWVDHPQTVKVYVHDESAFQFGCGETELEELEKKAGKYLKKVSEMEKLAKFGKLVNGGATKIADKLQPYLNKIPKVLSPIKPYANINGAAYARVSEDCFEDKPVVKIAIEGGITFAVGVKGTWPTAWSIPKLGGVHIIFDLGLSAMLKPHFDFYFGPDVRCPDFGFDVPIDLTGGIGASAAISDPDVLSVNAMARLRLNATLSYTICNGGSFGGFILNGELYFYVTAMSMKVAEYTVQLFRSDLSN